MLKKPFTWKLAYPLFHKKPKIHCEEKQPTTWESAHEPDLSWDFQDSHQYQNVLVDNDRDDPLYANVMSEIYQVPTTLPGSDDDGDDADYANIMFNKDHVENENANAIYENAEVKAAVNADSSAFDGCDMNDEVHNSLYENANTSKVCTNGGAITVLQLKNTVLGNGSASMDTVTTINAHNIYENAVTLNASSADARSPAVVRSSADARSPAVVQNGVADSPAVVQNGVADSPAVVQNGVADSPAVALNGVADSPAVALNGVADSPAVALNGVADSPAVALNGVADSPAVALNGVADSPAVALNGVADSPAVALNGVADSPAVALNGVADSPADALNGVGDSPADALNGVGDSPADALNGVGDSPAVSASGIGGISKGDGNAVGDTSEAVENVSENTATLNGGGNAANGICENTASASVEAESVLKCAEDVAKADECVRENVESAPVIEISDDGSWETKELQKAPKDEDQDQDQDQESGEDARRVVMEEQTVRARKIDSWLRDKDAQGDVVYDSILQNKHKTKSYWEQRMMAAEAEAEAGAGTGVGPKIVQAVAKPASASASPPRTAAMIALELREMKVREEELRRARHEPDEGSCSEYGSEDKNSVDGSPHGFSHQRTQSLDSMSSGHSSGSDFNVARHRIMVKPLDEPQEDEIPVYMRMGHKTVAAVPVLHNSDTDIRRQGETPIEREIRLAREREEELRREKGLPPVNMSNSTNKTEYRRSTSRNALNNSDPRSVQHRLATSRIQQEINEATERERELRAAGTIQTTSEDTVDSKLTRFTDLADFAIEERERKMKKSVSTSNIPVEVRNEPESSPPVVTPAFRVGTLYNSNRATGIVTTKRFSPASGNKGLMQRFYASHGKVNMINSIRSVLNAPITATTPVSPAPVSNSNVYTPVVARKPVEVATYVDMESVEEVEEIQPMSVRTPVRRGYQSAEEKIQAELQEMQRREEELRLQRAQMFAVSHPNLSSIGKDEEDHVGNLMNGSHTSSNPNLIDSEDSSSLELLETSSEMQPHRNTGRRRIALIQEWENRIMMNTEH